MTATRNEATDERIDAYVRQCEPYFADLDEPIRMSLASDVREIVAEVVAELDGDPADLVGQPQAFSDELRAAAGHPSPKRAAAATTQREQLGSLIAGAIRRWATSTALPWCRTLFRELRPAWWVARGLGVALALDADHLRSGHGLLPELFGLGVIWLAVAAVFVVLSVELGRGSLLPKGWKRRIAIFASSALAIWAFVFVATDIQSAWGFGATISFEGDAVPAPSLMNAYEFIEVNDLTSGAVLFSGDATYGEFLQVVESLRPTETANRDGYAVLIGLGEQNEVFRVDSWDAVIDLVQERLLADLGPIVDYPDAVGVGR